MILAGVSMLLRGNLQSHLISCFKHAFRHTAHMAHLAAQQLDGILYLKLSVGTSDHTGISLLASHGGIERSLFYENGACLAVCQSFHNLSLCGQDCDFRLIGQPVITHKFCSDARINLIVDRSVRTHIVGHGAGLSCLHALLFHGSLEAFLIHGHSLFFQDLLGQIHRKSVGIIQLEGVLAGEGLLSLCLHIRFHLCQDIQSLIDGLIEFLLFLIKNLKDKGSLLIQFRITVLGPLDHALA